MNVLVITGDKKFKEGHERFDLQVGAVEKLEAVFWGKGALMPKIPQGDFDVITVQDPFLRGLFAWYVACRKSAKLNIQVHTDLLVQSFLRHLVARFVLRRADSVRVVSNRIKEQVLSMGITVPVYMLPVFIDLSKFHNVVRKLHVAPIILWLGRFEEEKNPLEAISVLEKVREAGIDAELIMLGAGSMKEKIIKKANNNPKIKVLDWQNPVPYFEKANVVLSTSLHEGWGASIVEALAAGVPVVAPDVGVAKEAGARVVPRENLAEEVIDILKRDTEAELKLKLIEDPDKWAETWKKTLL